jgi:hypothetical protein
MFLHLTPTLLRFPQSSPPPSQKMRKEVILDLFPYIEYFITTILQMETLKPSLFIELSTFENFVLSPQLLLELSTLIPCIVKHYDLSKSKVHLQNLNIFYQIFCSVCTYQLNLHPSSSIFWEKYIHLLPSYS